MLFLILFFLEILLLFFLSKLLTKSLSKALLIITKSQNITINILAILFLPGVVVHELSHLLIASILFVQTGEIEFLPKLLKDGVKLGSVAIAKTDPIRRAIIGFAPVVVGLSIILGLVYLQLHFASFWGDQLSWATPESVSWRFWTSQNDGVWAKFFLSAIIFYLLFAISNTMFSSKKDMEGTLELLIVVAIIFTALYTIGFHPPSSIIQILYSGKVLEFMERADLFLLVPIGIDISAVGLLAVIKSKL